MDISVYLSMFITQLSVNVPKLVIFIVANSFFFNSQRQFNKTAKRQKHAMEMRDFTRLHFHNSTHVYCMLCQSKIIYYEHTGKTVYSVLYACDTKMVSHSAECLR